MKITKAEFEALPDGVKSLFAPTDGGADYISQTTADKALKEKNDELLKELKGKGDLLKNFEGLDAEAAKKALAEMSKLEDEKLVSKQKFDEVLAKREKEFSDRLAQIQTNYDRRFSGEADKDLQIKLIAGGVREDRAEDLAIILKSKNIKAVDDNGKTVWKSLDDVETVDLDKFIPGLKDSRADFFKPTGASGSGASGSNGSGGNSGDVQPGIPRMAAAYSKTTT